MCRPPWPSFAAWSSCGVPGLLSAFLFLFCGDLSADGHTSVRILVLVPTSLHTPAVPGRERAPHSARGCRRRAAGADLLGGSMNSPRRAICHAPFIPHPQSKPPGSALSLSPHQRPRLFCSNARHHLRPSIESGCTPPPARMRPRPPFASACPMHTPLSAPAAPRLLVPQRSTPPHRSLAHTTTSPLYFTARWTTPSITPEPSREHHARDPARLRTEPTLLPDCNISSLTPSRTHTLYTTQRTLEPRPLSPPALTTCRASGSRRLNRLRPLPARRDPAARSSRPPYTPISLHQRSLVLGAGSSIRSPGPVSILAPVSPPLLDACAWAHPTTTHPPPTVLATHAASVPPCRRRFLRLVMHCEPSISATVDAHTVHTRRLQRPRHPFLVAHPAAVATGRHPSSPGVNARTLEDSVQLSDRTLRCPRDTNKLY
ncbi:hypothetical protein B0H13DRAFT_2506412 [Mycena leptocephala]|nr:hypothetical protein B0H13DRAFT_2506412 [Mycena leptocephala]